MKRKKKDKIKPFYYKKTRIIVSILTSIVIFMILMTLYSFINTSFADYIWLNIRNPYYEKMFIIFGNKKFLGSYLFLIIYALAVILLIIEYTIINIKKIQFNKRNKIYNIFEPIIVFLVILSCIPITLSFSITNNSKINEKYFSNNINKSYNYDDVVNLAEYLKNKVMILSSEFERDKNNKIIYSKDILDESINSLKNISDKYTFLKGEYPKKITKFSKKEHQNNTDNVLAYTSNYTISYDPYFDDALLINTLTHELCHSKGIIRESEAVFCSFIANTNSKDKLTQYSGYLELFNRVLTTLQLIDSNKGTEIEEDVANLCLINNYSEICNMYIKDTKVFQKDTDHIYFITYLLRNYKDYKTQFNYLLDILINNYNANIKINGEERKFSIEEINNLIDNDSTDYISLNIEINENTFDEFINYIKDYQNYFLAISQISRNDKDLKLEYGEKALEYYLKPFKGNDIKLIFNGTYEKEYDYERVTRLLLEYLY